MAHINLLPWRELERQERQSDFVRILLVGLLVGVLIMIVVQYYVSAQVDRQTSRNIFLNKEIAVLNGKIKQIKDLEKTKRKLIARMRVIQQLQASRPKIVHLFDEVARTIPQGVYLTSMVQRGNALSMEGKAQSNGRISTYMRLLDKNTWVYKPKLTVINGKRGGSAGENTFKMKAKQRRKPKKKARRS